MVSAGSLIMDQLPSGVTCLPKPMYSCGLSSVIIKGLLLLLLPLCVCSVTIGSWIPFLLLTAAEFACMSGTEAVGGQ